MSFYILSNRANISSVSCDALFAFEDLLVEMCKSKILTPRKKSSSLKNKFLKKIHNRIAGEYFLEEETLNSIGTGNILFICGISGSEIGMLSAFPKVEKYFDRIVIYIWDSWGYGYIWPKRFIKYINHIFVGVSDVVDPINHYFQKPVSFMPFGTNSLTHSSMRPDRPIDLISYGRIPDSFNFAFHKGFNEPGSGYAYLRMIPRATVFPPPYSYENRLDKVDLKSLYKILRRSKMGVVFDTLYPGMRKFPYSVLTMRSFESISAGCVVVGKRPTTADFEKYFGWEDSVIDIPSDPDQSVSFLKDLLRDDARIAQIRKRNYYESLIRNDWRLRIKNMLTELNLPIPQPLQNDLSLLKQKADLVFKRL